MLNRTITLSNGYKIPSIGFGTWKAPDDETTVAAVKKAIECGYTHIDGAAIYRNEKSVGRGIAESGIPREELFVTSKLWGTERGYDKTIAAFEKTLSDLGLEYLDLYLIHWPANEKHHKDWQEQNAETWRAFEDLYKQGRIKAIGVSNFLVHHMEALLKTAEIVPMIDQLEFHPGYMQSEIVEYCRRKGICLEAWSPLGTGRMLSNEMLGEIAEKYGVSVAQICIRWCLQNDALPLVKSITPSRIKENIDVWDFEISAEDMQRINAMDFCGGSGLYPDEVNF